MKKPKNREQSAYSYTSHKLWGWDLNPKKFLSTLAFFVTITILLPRRKCPTIGFLVDVQYSCHKQLSEKVWNSFWNYMHSALPDRSISILPRLWHVNSVCLHYMFKITWTILNLFLLLRVFHHLFISIGKIHFWVGCHSNNLNVRFRQQIKLELGYIIQKHPIPSNTFITTNATMKEKAFIDRSSMIQVLYLIRLHIK